MKKKINWTGIILVIAIGAGIWFTWPSRDIYVSDQKLDIVQAEWAQPNKDLSIEGNPLQIGGKFYVKGIGTHPLSQISVSVPKGYTHFTAEAGVDDEIAPDLPANVIFSVTGDNAVLYESPVLKPDMQPYRILVDIRNYEKITLQVKGGPNGTIAGHSDWGNARFLKRW